MCRDEVASDGESVVALSLSTLECRYIVSHELHNELSRSIHNASNKVSGIPENPHKASPWSSWIQAQLNTREVVAEGNSVVSVVQGDVDPRPAHVRDVPREKYSSQVRDCLNGEAAA